MSDFLGPLIAPLFDVSGSMLVHLEPMTDAFNKFIVAQARASDDGAQVFMAQFADTYKVVMTRRPISDALEYKPEPLGGTALFDAIGRHIEEINALLADDREYRRVIVPVITDGGDNTSKVYTVEMARAWIEYQRTAYRWEFVFLGANINAVKTAAALGIPERNALTYDTGRAGDTFGILDKHVRTIRAGGTAAFDTEDRKKALGR